MFANGVALSPDEDYVLVNEWSGYRIRRLWIAYVAVLLATVGASLLVHGHGYFRIDGTFAFNAWYGFASCIGMILGAKALGRLLKRKDGYYDGD